MLIFRHTDCLSDVVSLQSANARASIIVAVVRKIRVGYSFHLYPAATCSNRIRTLAIYASEPAADILAVSFTVIIFAAQFKKH
jgi:hypothetical protein